MASKFPFAGRNILSKAEILELLKISHRRFYMRPKFLARQVLGLSTGLNSGALHRGSASQVGAPGFQEQNCTS